MPTYAYELDQAVNDGFLVPPRAITVPLKFLQEGIKYNELSEEEKAEYEKEFRDEQTGLFPEEIHSGALNRWLFNSDTVDKVLGFLMERGIKVKGGDKLGKTIIFAKNHKHAEFIEKRFNKIFPEYRGKFLQIIDNQIKYAQDRIDTFSDDHKDPTVALSVDMLDTGIDIPEIVNLVFFKIVRSKSKFWQMIGRGTRLRPALFGPYDDKTHFLIFDFCDNFAFFEENPQGIKGHMQESLSKIIFVQRLNLLHKLQSAEYQEDVDYRKLYTSLLDSMYEEVNGIDRNSFLARPHLRYIDEYNERKRWNNITQSDIATITEHLAHLPATYDEDEFAKRFDLLILNIQLTLLETSRAQGELVIKLTGIAESLEKKANVPLVAAHIQLIRTIQTDEFIQNLNVVALERVRKALRELIKFLERETQKIVYTDFKDTLGEATGIYDVATSDRSLINYRKRFEKYVREHTDHITINKLRLNKPITATDLKELERMLFDRDVLGTREDFEKAYGTDMPLGFFIRSIVGLDRNVAKESFSEFMGMGALTPEQITFINSIIDYLTFNGIMEPGKLFETPFTDIHSSGVVGVFPSKEVKHLFKIVESINSNAGVA